MEELTKKNNKKVIIIVIMIILLLALIVGSYFIYQKVNKDNHNGNQDIESKYTLELKHDSYGNICNQENCSEDYNEKYVLKTVTEDAKYLNIDSLLKRFILYKDNDLKIYDIYTKEITTIELEENPSNEYQILVNSELTKPTGIIVTNKDTNNSDLYNLITNKTISLKKLMNEENNIYDNYNKNKIFDGKYLIVTTGTSPQYDYVINVDTLETKLRGSEYKKENECGETASKVIKSDNNYYFYVSCTASSSPIKEKIYNEQGNLIINMNDTDDFENMYYSYSTNDGYLYVANRTKILKYNKDGKLLETITDYKNIYGLVDDYVFNKDDSNYLTISNLNSKKTVKLLDLTNNESLNFDYWQFSVSNKNVDYYKNTIYKELNELAPGMYFTLEGYNQGGSYNDGFSTKYYYNPKTEELKEVK